MSTPGAPELEPNRRRHRRRATRAAAAAGTVLAVAALATPVRAMLPVPTPGVDAPEGSVVFNYHCSSTVAESDETYTISGTAPAEVVEGTSFTLDDVVITGTPSVDLLLVTLTFALDAPIGATSVDGLSRTFAGPGSTDPPGPIAPAGTPNSSPPMTFGFTANGAVGTTIDFFSGNVSSVVADIDMPSYTVPVTCTRTGGGAFASTRIVAAPPETTTTTSTTSTSTTTTTAVATTVDPSAVLASGATNVAATPVSVRPAFTG